MATVVTGVVRLAFLHYGQASDDIAQVMLASARKHMPGIVTVQVTDARTPALEGVDEVVRVRSPRYTRLQCEGMALVAEPYIRVDTDMVFCADLREVFAMPGAWRIAGCLHGDPLMNATAFGREYPYSGAVVAFRDGGSAAYWQKIARLHDQARALGRDDWMGCVMSANEAARIMHEQGDLVYLPGSTWNYSPTTRYDIPTTAKVLHYKGNRKTWMAQAESVKTYTKHLEKRVFAFGERAMFVYEPNGADRAPVQATAPAPAPVPAQNQSPTLAP